MSENFILWVKWLIVKYTLVLVFKKIWDVILVLLLAQTLFTSVSGDVPVSYTHLDVYKRQDEDRTLFTKMLHGQDDNIKDSIRMLSQLLYKHYGDHM